MMSVIIFGASGFLGRNLMWHLASAGHDVVGTYNSRAAPGLVKFDLANPNLSTLEQTGSAARNSQGFHFAVICSSITMMDECLEKPGPSYAVNVAGVKSLVDQLLARNIKPVFISTDYVYDGLSGSYSEDDERRPVLAYGRQKKEVEDYLMQSGREYLLVRLARLYSCNPAEGTLLTSIAGDLGQGKRLKLASDQVFNPTHVYDVCSAISLMMRNKMSGAYNVCAGEAMSRHGVGVMVKEALGIKTGKIEQCSLSEFSFPDKRPLNTSMANRKFVSETGFSFRSVSESLSYLVDSYGKIRQ